MKKSSSGNSIPIFSVKNPDPCKKKRKKNGAFRENGHGEGFCLCPSSWTSLNIGSIPINSQSRIHAPILAKKKKKKMENFVEDGHVESFCLYPSSWTSLNIGGSERYCDILVVSQNRYSYSF